MANDADGNVVINANIDPRGAIQVLEKLKKIIARTFTSKDPVQLQKDIKSITDEIKAQEKALKDLQKQQKAEQKTYDKVKANPFGADKEGKAESARLAQLQAEYEKLSSDARTAINRRNDIAMGRTQIKSIDEATNKLATLETEYTKATQNIDRSRNTYQTAYNQWLNKQAENEAKLKDLLTRSTEKETERTPILRTTSAGIRYFSAKDSKLLNNINTSLRMSETRANNARVAFENYANTIRQYRELSQYITNASADVMNTTEFKEADARVTVLGEKLKATVADLDPLQQKQDNILADAHKGLDEINPKIEQTSNKINDLTNRLGEMREELVDEQTHGPGFLAGMFDSARKSASRLWFRLKSMTIRSLFFATFGKAIRGFIKYIGLAIEKDDELNKSVGRLKGQFAVTFQLIYNYVYPILKSIINIILQTVAALNRLIAALTHQTIDAATESAKAMDDYAKAAKGAGKETEKTFASFDEINVIGKTNESGGGPGSGIDSIFDTNGIIDKVKELDLYLAGFLLGLGAVLTFSGANIPLGLALMAVGATRIAQELTLDWDKMDDETRHALTKIFVTIGGFGLVIGAILTFSGANPALGIGIMLASAAMLGTAVALNWDTVKNWLKDNLAKISAIVSAALLVLGFILLANPGSLPLAIALIAAGAIGLVTTVALSWNKISTEVKNIITVIAGIASGALLAIGLVLLANPASLPLAIALIAVGAVGLVTTVALNWDRIVQLVRGPLGILLTIAGGAMLAIGLVLLANPASLPLAIALIAAGAGTLVTVTALNWDIILEKIKGVWDKIKTWWNQHVAPIFTKEFWRNKWDSLKDGAKASLNGLLITIQAAINNAIEAINKFLSFRIPDDWDLFGRFAGRRIGANIPYVTLPRLAQGAVIPANKEFLAVLGDQKHGTNIETPLDTMVQAFTQALDSRGGGQTVIRFEGQLAPLARILKPYIDQEGSRQGTRLSRIGTV